MLYSVEPGSVIYVARDIVHATLPYEHYGIYAGNNEVIHFAPLGDTECIHRAPISEFGGIQGLEGCFVRNFPETRRGLELILRNKKVSSDRREFILNNYQFFSARETLRRAESAINSSEWSYDVFGENCEHFAFWCKTGIKNSSQVEDLMKFLF